MPALAGIGFGSGDGAKHAESDTGPDSDTPAAAAPASARSAPRTPAYAATADAPLRLLDEVASEVVARDRGAGHADHCGLSRSECRKHDGNASQRRDDN